MSGERLRAALQANGHDLLGYFERRVASRADAADLVGETFLQAWRRVDDLPADAVPARMWLYTVARHVLANHHRSTRRRGALTQRLREIVAAAPVAPDPAEAVEVRDAVRRLPEAHRELVMLVHWDGLTLAEAATVLGLNASTARGRYAAARSALETALRDPTATAAPTASL